MTLVVDPSALLALALDDEAADYAESVLSEIVNGSAVVPAIFWFEIRNVLVVNEWRERLSSHRTDLFLAALEDLPIEIAPLPSDLSLMDLAREQQLTVYDASYLDLASSRQLPLATLDRELREAAETVGVEIFGT